MHFCVDQWKILRSWKKKLNLILDFCLFAEKIKEKQKDKVFIFCFTITDVIEKLFEKMEENLLGFY